MASGSPWRSALTATPGHTGIDAVRGRKAPVRYDTCIFIIVTITSIVVVTNAVVMMIILHD